MYIHSGSGLYTICTLNLHTMQIQGKYNVCCPIACLSYNVKCVIIFVYCFVNAKKNIKLNQTFKELLKTSLINS